MKGPDAGLIKAEFQMNAALAKFACRLGAARIRAGGVATSALPPEQQQIHAVMPSIAYVFFGIAVFSGVLGAIGLLLKKRWALPLLLLSFLGVAAQMATAYATTPVWALTGAGGVVFPLMLVVVCLLLWLFARKAAARGWIG